MYASRGPQGSTSGSRPSTSMLLISVLSLLAASVTAQQDPVNNFCRRFGHQTAVVDNKLFIDGGFVNYNFVEDPSNYTNRNLLYQDLSQNAVNVQMPQLNANLSKNGSIPSVSGGSLWADNVNKRIYLFGGEHSGEPPSPFGLFSYDVLNNQWDSHGQPRSGFLINTVSWGAGASVDQIGQAFYYGGWLSNASVPGWGNAPPVATNGLVTYTMDSNSWTNSSGPDSTRRAEGSLLYIPAGAGGMLVYFGGVQDLNTNGTAEGQPMDQIFMYDMLSSKWFSQKATGDIPPQRRRFCAGVTWAPDQSSYNIYMYGGNTVPGQLGPGYDDLYILTLPTFTWIRVFVGTGNNQHHSLTCNMVPSGAGAQMLIIGGTFPASSDCDYPVQWGTHNVDLGKQNVDKSIWFNFAPNKTTYAVPDTVFSVVGGGPTGGATKTGPAGGWDSNDLGVDMAQKASLTARAPTRAVSASASGSDGSSGINWLTTGAIAGVAVGAVVVALLLVLACLCLIRRHRKRKYQHPQRPGPFHTHSMSEAWSPPTTHMSPAATPYSPPYGPSPFMPPPQSMSPGPTMPAELPSAHVSPVPTAVPTPSPAPMPTPNPQVSGSATMPMTGGAAAAAAAGSSIARASSVTYPPQQAYFPDPVTLSNQVQIDANGNMWVPQVSMVQVATGSLGPGSPPPGSHGGTPPMYTPPTGDRKSPMPTPSPAPTHHTAPVGGYAPTPPAELPSAPQEMSAEPVERPGQRSSQHQTYYNK
ncbi:cell wall anchored protein [Colletotrichum sojae]|uniref:Cell wall anchored protein n=1 Tax=Colletotrichum sojae TaxID=2175907 RepID=A0A8H6N517_9PEZI|nr:cell wall anchored protein [Colletotrichum sojae]